MKNSKVNNQVIGERTFNLQGYEKLTQKQYQREKFRLRVELIKLQESVIKENRKVAVVFEGRDSAGKTDTAKQFSKYLIPKQVKYINLGIPTEWESKHWFKRYEKLMPKNGEMIFFDRSWYNRALIEPTLGFCTQRQYKNFMKNVNDWELEYINNGTEIIKFYLSIDKTIQRNRLNARKNSPIKHWKFSHIDKMIIDKFDVLTLYKEQMFKQTSTKICPWIVIDSSNKRLARITAMHYLLNSTEYENKKVLKPKKWSKEIKSYSYSYEGELFDGLTYNQYKILSENLG